MTILDRVLPSDRLVVTDGGHADRWVLDGISVPDADDSLFTLDLGSICLGLPMGFGATVALEPSEQSCVTFCGDAGLLVSLPELETAARNDLQITVVVLNDEGLGSEIHAMRSAGLNAEPAFVDSPDIADVARELGCRSHTVRNASDVHKIGDILGQKPDGPLLVDCKIDSSVRHRSKM